MSFLVRTRRARLAMIVGVMIVAPVAAQDPAQTPRFTSGVELALVDLFAISSTGMPVTDLRAEEVSVKLDGKTRPVRFLELTRIAEPPRSVDPMPVSDLPAPYGTNKPAPEGRTILIVIDDESFRPGVERPMRAALHELVGNLPALDRVAVATLPHGGLKTDLTTKREPVLAAIDNVVGLAPQSQLSTEVACRTRFTLEALAGLLGSLQGGRGPTTVLFFSSGMFGPRRGDTLQTAPRMAPTIRPPTSNTCDIRPEDFFDVGTAAATARARVYIIQPDEALSGGGVTIEIAAGTNGSTNLREGLEFLAGSTGGQQLSVAVAGSNPLTRIVRETSSYYVVGFQLDPSDVTGAPHTFDMRVDREGVSVHALPQFAMSRSTRTRSAVGGGSPKDMLRDSTVFRGLPIRAAAFSSRYLDDQTLKVITIAEPVDPSVPLTGAAVALFDVTGRLSGQWTATDAELAHLPLTAVLVAPPGQYRLRVAAVDQTGRGGTADSDLFVELAPAGPLKLSSLVLGLMRNSQFIPKLEFGAEAVAISSLEIYGGSAGARISALIEIAATLNGPAIMQMPLVIEATDVPNRFTATGAVPIGSLPPGDYIVRAIVGLEGQPSGRVVRTLRKTN